MKFNRYKCFLSIITILILLTWYIPVDADFKSVPDGYNQFAANEYLELFFDPNTCEILLIDKETGNYFFSNPPDRKEDKVAMNVYITNLSSQLLFSILDVKTMQVNTKNSFIGVVKKGNFKFEKIANGVKVNYSLKAEEISLSIEYTLDKDSLRVNLPMEELQEGKQYKLESISVLPYFCAGTSNEDGYILVPDGSGALIDFNNKKLGYAQYSQNIYGDDDIYEESSKVLSQKINMPLFGINRGNFGLLAVTLNGDALGKINASSGGMTTGYNNAYFSFSLKQSNNISLGTELVQKYDNGKTTLGNIEIKYYPLKKENCNYNGMARKYKQLLFNNTSSNKNDSSDPLYITLYGAIQKRDNVLGIPLYETKELTKYNDALKILEKLVNNGVDDIVVIYKGSMKKEVKGEITNKFQPLSSLGGSKGFEKLAQYCNQNNIELCLDANFTTFSNGSNLLSKITDTVKNVALMPVKKHKTNIVTGFDVPYTKVWYLYQPQKIQKAAASFVKSLEKYDNVVVNFNTLANSLYSDYSSSKSSRQDSKKYFENTMEYIAKQNGDGLAENANIFACNYIKHDINLPTSSSNYDVCDSSIPFYQMVLSGKVSYSTPYVNLSEEPDIMFLNAVENGSMLSYAWISGDPKIFRNTEFEYLYSTDYKLWISEAINKYKELCNITEQIKNADIISHSTVEPGVKCTTYSNDVKIYVNYNEHDVLTENVSVKAENYTVVAKGAR